MVPQWFIVHCGRSVDVATLRWGRTPIEHGTCLLYLLTVGRNKELVLRVRGTQLSIEQLTAWMAEESVRALTVSRFGDEQTSALLLNFRHVVGARLAPYGETRTGSFRPARPRAAVVASFAGTTRSGYGDSIRVSSAIPAALRRPSAAGDFSFTGRHCAGQERYG
ncbi:hypothetical protein AB0M46_04360 [Dactylosporangium sp. NPDC051485]|uniref:hypothetical protein n=1 Tax=Dactylosporangium sp. NPDC051485 TaxID=3154846 RepID=UPI00343D92C0